MLAIPSLQALLLIGIVQPFFTDNCFQTDPCDKDPSQNHEKYVYFPLKAQSGDTTAH